MKHYRVATHHNKLHTVGRERLDNLLDRWPTPARRTGRELAQPRKLSILLPKRIEHRQAFGICALARLKRIGIVNLPHSHEGRVNWLFGAHRAEPTTRPLPA